MAGVHGVRGAVRIKYFTADSALLQAYGPLYDETGTERLEITIKSTLKGVVIAEVEGIDDRDAAEALKGLRLCVERSAFPEPGENEYYHADLIGLPVRLVVSEKTLAEGAVEWKERTSDEVKMVPLGDIITVLQQYRET